MKKLSFIMVLLLAVTLTFTMGVAADDAEPADVGDEVPENLVVGMVPSREAGVMMDSIDPMTEMLEDELDIPVEGTVLTSFTSVIEAMGTGRVDIGIFGPFALVLGEERHDLEIILNSIRFGEDHYFAQFYAREDSGIESVEDLEGKSAAFVDPASTAGYLFPYVHMLDHGIDPDEDLSEQIFAGAHDAAVIAVYNEEADFGVSFDDAREDVEDEYPDVMDVVNVFEFTEEIPNDGIAVRRELDPDLVADIQQAFVNIGETEEGEELLDTLYNVSGFVPAGPERYDVVRRTYEEMEEYVDF